VKNTALSLLTILFLSNSEFSYSQQKLFTLLPPDSTGVDFSNVIYDSKEINIINYEYYYNGAGAAIGDVNNDSLPDLFFTSNRYECKLYLNKGNLKFEDVTAKAGVTGGFNTYKTGAVMVDINNDGWMDIYVGRSVSSNPVDRRNLMYVNNRDGTFTDRAEEYGIADDGFTTCGYFNDMDEDGDLDLLVVNHPYNFGETDRIHLTYNKEGKLVAVKDKPLYGESNQYYVNVNGKYVNKTKSAGLVTRSFGLSAILQDFNDDGLTDIYQANDYLEPDYLFINKGNNTFVNEYEKYFRHGSYSSMGSDYADINNDGFSDLVTTDMLPEGNTRQKQLRRPNNYDQFDKAIKYGYGHQYMKNVLQLNNGNGSYSDISYFTGIAYSDWSWAVLMADFDNDGFKDVYIVNGYVRDVTDMDYVKFDADSLKKKLVTLNDANDILKLLSIIPSVKVQKSYFKNYGGLNFKKETKESGLEQHAWSSGGAYADLDNDGDLELVVVNSNDYAFIYKNNTVESKKGNSIRVKLIGPSNNINGIETKIESVSPNGLKTTTVFNPMKGYLSSNDYTTVIGIGKNTNANLTITWPDGKQQLLQNVSNEKVHTIPYTYAVLPVQKTVETKKLFADISSNTKVNFTHTENDYIDFKLEPLLPHRFSQLGPCLAVADFNGDKLEDLFIGGSKNRSSALFLQQAEGTFTESKQAAFDADKIFEDGAAQATDIDNDTDLDLIVTCGGNEYPNAEAKYPVRFYTNDGKGNFSKSMIGGNKFFTSSNTVAVSDYNKDGNPDIFIGGRVVPGRYGLVPKSFLLTIKKDSIENVTSPAALHKIGMVTSAAWTDFDNNGWADLVLAGEWMPVTIFYNTNGTLSDNPAVIENSYGWWNRIAIADLNGDGRQDIIAGNLGKNTRYQGSPEKPVSMVVSDFDNNGSTDCLISVFVKDKSYPISLRDYVLDQMPYLRKKFLRNRQYATATIEEIFTAEQLNKADKFLANNMSSTIFINNGNGSFTPKELPVEAQLFPVFGIQVANVNDDKIPDLLLSGNDYATEVETGRNDAGIGLLLIGNDNMEYTAVPVTQSGFYTPGNVKCLEKITLSGKPAYIAGKNQDKLQFLQLAEKE
jgi:enediyne biosynthesis protein E4